MAPWHVEMLGAVRDHDRISIRAGRGVGKTTALAWCAFWRNLCFTPSRNIFTSPRKEQLSMAAWAEMRKWHRAMHPSLARFFEVQASKVIMRGNDGNLSIATTVGSGLTDYAGLLGIHDASLLWIVDEANGVDDPVFTTALGSLTTKGGKVLLTGNPRQSSGFFFRTHMNKKMARRWRTMAVSAFDVKDMSYFDPEWIEEMRDTFGEGSPDWSAYVLGEFPSEQENAVIPLSTIIDAASREVELTDGSFPIWGFDPAAGGDRCVLAKRHANVLEDLVVWREKDTTLSVDRIISDYIATPEHKKPAAIVVDAIGLGIPIADQLRQRKLPIIYWVSSENSVQKTRYRNKRSEMWHYGRDWFSSRVVKIPDDEELVEELAAPTRTVPNDRNTEYGSAYIIEPKDEIRKRIGRSTDKADAVLLTFCAQWKEADTDLISRRLDEARRRGLHRRRMDENPNATWMSQ